MKKTGYGINGDLTKEQWDTIMEDLAPPPIYYRILVGYQSGEPVVATLQDFDEYDYDHERYLTLQKYDTEEEAEKDAFYFTLFQQTKNQNVIRHIPEVQYSALRMLLSK